MIDVLNSSLKKESAPKAGTRWHCRYPRRLSEYAKSYGRSVDTIKAWVHRGKRSGFLPPLEHADQLPSWYSEHVGSVPDDLLVLCVPNVADQRSANGARPISLDQAGAELRKILAHEIDTLNGAAISDTRRAMLLRSIQGTLKSLCELERTKADVRSNERDAMPWGAYAQNIIDIAETLVTIRQGWPRRLYVELEKEFCLHHHRILKVIKEPLMRAVAKVCDGDVSILVNCHDLQPIVEKLISRYRELEQAAKQAFADGKTAIPLTFEPIATEETPL